MSGRGGPGGSSGYPGQGYGAPDDGNPRRPRPRRPGGGQQQRNGSVWEADHGYARYEAQPGRADQDVNGPGYGDQGYGDPGPGPREYGQPGAPAYPPPGQGSGGYPQQGADPRRDAGRRQGNGRRPGNGPRQGQFDGNDPRRAARGYDQPGGYGQPGGYDQHGDRARNQDGHDDWEQDQGENSFLPGFGRRGEYDDPRAGTRAPGRDDRYGRDDGRGPGRARPDERRPDDIRPDGRGFAVGPGDRGGPGDSGDPGGPGGPGPDQRGWDNGPREHDPYDDWNDRNRKPRKKATRWFPRILILTIVAVVVVGGLVGGLDLRNRYEARYHPPDYAGPGTGDVTVQVTSGDTAFSLAPRLLQLGVIASTRAFTNAAEAATGTTSAGSGGLEAGYYQLHEHMQASLAYAALTNPKNLVQTTVTIPEGKRAVDVIAIIAQKTKIPLKNFQQVLAHPSDLGLPSYADGKVEGYLFPATYAIVPHETALQILQAMVQRFNVEAQQVNLVAAAKAVGLSPTQLIIEASLAQAEGGSVSDYPKIAEVIHNRLASGMHLQFDSTVLYGLGKYAVSATFAQINTAGPYNTYLNAGLPAGPISNPGDAAIQGILHPDHGDWLYFLTVPDGKSQFSATPLKGQ